PDLAGMDAYRMSARPLCFRAERLQQVQQGADVPNVRHILQHHLLVREERSCDHRECGILVPGRTYAALQLVAALYDELRHLILLFPSDSTRGPAGTAPSAPPECLRQRSKDRARPPRCRCACSLTLFGCCG